MSGSPVHALGRIEVTYPPAGGAPCVSVAGQPVPIEVALPAEGTRAFALAAGPESVLIADRDAQIAVLVPREGPERAPVYVAGPDPRHAGRFCVTTHPPATAAGVVYVAQAFGHTTGWVPAVHGALARLHEPTRFTAAIRRQEDAAHAQRKTADGHGGMHVVPLVYSDAESATITTEDVAHVSRPALLNREAALLWIADNLALAQASAGAAVIVNDCRPETWILHQLAENAQGKEVPLHAVRYAFEDFAWVRQIARKAGSANVAPAIADLVAASAPAIHTRQALEDALRAAGIDPRRNPSVDFEAASRAILAGVPERGTIWYQAVNWRDGLGLESGESPYLVIPPLGQPSPLSPDQAAVRAGAVLRRHAPALEGLFTLEDPRGVVLVSQGNGFSAHSRRHWSAMLALAARILDTQFLFAGGTAEDRAWLKEASRPANVTLLGWIDEEWSTFLRALAAKPRTALVCRPGLSSIGAALVNGVPPLLMTPDPLGEPVDAITAEVAMERAVYAFQLERLYAAQCPTHRESPLPVLVDTLGRDPEKALATLRRALDPAVKLRQRAAIDGYCSWSRVAHLIASVLAREAASGALPIQAKRRLRDQELSARRGAPQARRADEQTLPLP
ncbi:hypothetical protein [Polyangium sp. 6x1]|uniref:hypothetical protein n=1 Tax=Polyangium sp. 6x1 TaxID=3042689 RepID=UPI0024826A6F|nr:hypothetical protein [Polyangium sp. 6x1]MDI1447539.1 hypothetical protein [Polyangium sp. 6x1]